MLVCYCINFKIHVYSTYNTSLDSVYLPLQTIYYKKIVLRNGCVRGKRCKLLLIFRERSIDMELQNIFEALTVALSGDIPLYTATIEKLKELQENNNTAQNEIERLTTVVTGLEESLKQNTEQLANVARMIPVDEKTKPQATFKQLIENMTFE